MSESYASGNPFRMREFGAVQALFLVTCGLFVVQLVVDRFTGGWMTHWLGLSSRGLSHGGVWQLVTYQFLHGGLLHIFMNMLMLAVFGRELEETLGPRRFLLLYLGCGVLAGLGWVAITGWSRPMVCIGASGAVFGITGAFAGLFPDRPIMLLLFFVLPLRMTARTMAIVLAVVTLLLLVATDQNVAHVAHLAGGVVGYLYGVAYRRSGRLWLPPRHPFDRLRRWWALRTGPPSETEVNGVLDTIARDGMGRLTRRERDILERSRRFGIRRDS